LGDFEAGSQIYFDTFYNKGLPPILNQIIPSKSSSTLGLLISNVNDKPCSEWLPNNVKLKFKVSNIKIQISNALDEIIKQFRNKPEYHWLRLKFNEILATNYLEDYFLHHGCLTLPTINLEDEKITIWESIVKKMEQAALDKNVSSLMTLNVNLPSCQSLISSKIVLKSKNSEVFVGSLIKLSYSFSLSSCLDTELEFSAKLEINRNHWVVCGCISTNFKLTNNQCFDLNISVIPLKTGYLPLPAANVECLNDYTCQTVMTTNGKQIYVTVPNTKPSTYFLGSILNSSNMMKSPSVFSIGQK
ncbi:hypothetical protein ROZALSC1DRAFT_25292, partial [Rozella allomycis CSF55]